MSLELVNESHEDLFFSVEGYTTPDRAIGKITPDIAGECFIKKDLSGVLGTAVNNFDEMIDDSPRRLVKLASKRVVELVKYTNEHGDIVRSIISLPKSGRAHGATLRRAYSVIESEWGIFGEHHMNEIYVDRDERDCYESDPRPITNGEIQMYSHLDEARPLEIPLMGLLSA